GHGQTRAKIFRIPVIKTGSIVRGSREIESKWSYSAGGQTFQTAIAASAEIVAQACGRCYLQPIRFPWRRKQRITKSRGHRQIWCELPRILQIHLVGIIGEPSRYRASVSESSTVLRKIVVGIHL